MIFILAFLVLSFASVIGETILLFDLNGNILNTTYYYVKIIKAFFNYKIYRVSKNKLEKDNKIIYLSNHRSWADFFVDYHVGNNNTVFISRMLVGFVVPLLSLTGILTGKIIFFHREAKNIGKVFEYIHKKFTKHPCNGLLVYPEGTRRLENKSCELKKGFIRYSYEKNIPIQIILTKNKEKVMNEKLFTVNSNIKLFTSYSEKIEPNKKQFKTLESYIEYIQKKWNKQWDHLYNTNDDKLLKENMGEIKNVKVPEDIKHKSKYNDMIMNFYRIRFYSMFLIPIIIYLLL